MLLSATLFSGLSVPILRVNMVPQYTDGPIICTGSEVARSCVDCELGFSYGLGEKEKLDIYGAQTLPGGKM